MTTTNLDNCDDDRLAWLRHSVAEANNTRRKPKFRALREGSEIALRGDYAGLRKLAKTIRSALERLRPEEPHGIGQAELAELRLELDTIAPDIARDRALLAAEVVSAQAQLSQIAPDLYDAASKTVAEIAATLETPAQPFVQPPLLAIELRVLELDREIRDLNADEAYGLLRGKLQSAEDGTSNPTTVIGEDNIQPIAETLGRRASALLSAIAASELIEHDLGAIHS